MFEGIFNQPVLNIGHHPEYQMNLHDAIAQSLLIIIPTVIFVLINKHKEKAD